MADELTATGLSIDDIETRRAAVVAVLRATISAILDFSPDQPTGQELDILLERIQAVMELLQLLYASFDPAQASNRSLDGVCSITGTYRNPATAGTVTLTVDLDAATTLPAGNIAAVAGDPDNQWVTTAAVTSVLAGPYPVAAQSTQTGPIQALATTISVIVTAFPGWNTVTNAADAEEGDAIETDAALRTRREIEVTIGGSTSVDAVRAAVSQVDDVDEVFCYENYLNVAVAPMPPKSIEIVYWDGGAGAADTAEIAEAIFTEKAGGIHPYGTAYVAHVDSQGNSHQIGMTLADEQRILVNITVVNDGNYVVGTVETALAAAGLGIDEDVYMAKMIDLAMDVAGVENVTVVQLAIFPAAPAAADIAIGARQIATIDSADVTVTVI